MTCNRWNKHYFAATAFANLCTQVVSLDWEKCRARIKSEVTNGTLLLNDTTIFHPNSTAEAPYLTFPACETYCGKGRTWYEDTGPILNTWLIPILILVSQMDVSPLDKRTYLVLFHLLGDPIDSIYSLLLKIEAWSRCRIRAEHEWNVRHAPGLIALESGETWKSRIKRRLIDFMARIKVAIWGRPGGVRRRWREIGNDEKAEFVRTLGTLLGGIEELVGEGFNPWEVYEKISLVPDIDIDRFRNDVAYELANSRTDDIYRTCLAVALFFYQVISGFVVRVGGNASSPPGGRIGICMFLTYILPAILMSNLLGNFTSASTCYSIFQKNLPAGIHLLPLLYPQRSASRKDVTEYFKARPWSGGIYTFRPEKYMFNDNFAGTRSRKLLFPLAISPVLFSTITGLSIIWHLPPAGVNCRWFVLLGISYLYFISTLITQASYVLSSKKSRLWRMIMCKDVVIAVPTVILLFLSSSGLFNTCWCWSGVMMHLHSREKAKVGLNTDLSFRPYITRLYPALFGICLTLQMLTFMVMFINGWKGLTLMRWSRYIMANQLVEFAEDLGHPTSAHGTAGIVIAQEGVPGRQHQNDLPSQAVVAAHSLGAGFQVEEPETGSDHELERFVTASSRGNDVVQQNPEREGLLS
ncbi:hypothetical protein GLAREA_08685 [Glarea lozoyensis ATCC 20868]|uniref:Uncharacterized protein n=1 Tax=Glarea lozoyensis (strain ATCC 20868 / MF5171) TaxID=1116229 RepID=S3DDK9_GLAL2|nr:uncharacterized protein GLAREA_08685 [Glarea lozoyensis ATCC 20868]EPE36522.1 hypothetical protein GLAREA_08685 [Glarea lozoyensis ATCC 20868]